MALSLALSVKSKWNEMSEFCDLNIFLLAGLAVVNILFIKFELSMLSDRHPRQSGL